MAAVIVIDIACTLMGQPDSYWVSPTSGHEGNDFFRPFLFMGHWQYLIWAAIYVAGTFAIVTYLPDRLGLATTYSFIFGHFFGASTWIYNVFGLGIGAVIGYGITLSIVMALISSRHTTCGKTQHQTS